MKILIVYYFQYDKNKHNIIYKNRICEWDRYGVRTIYLPPSPVTAAQSTTAQWRRSSAADRPSPSPDAFSAKSSRAVSHSSCTGRPAIILSKHCYTTLLCRPCVSGDIVGGKTKAFSAKNVVERALRNAYYNDIAIARRRLSRAQLFVRPDMRWSHKQ